MFTDTLTHAAFSRTLYVYLDCYDEVSKAKNESRSVNFSRKLFQNVITASYLGTFNVIGTYLNPSIRLQYPLLHTALLYTAPAIGGALIAIPIISKIIENSSENVKIVEYSALTQKIANTIAKIINLVFTVLYVYTAFGKNQAILTGVSLAYLTITGIKEELLRFDFDLKMI